MANIQKTAIVTGGSQGIGAGVVKAFLDRGYNVVANSRNITKANPFPASANLALVDGDIGDPKTAAKIVDTAVSRFGRVDVLINNAGIFIPKAFHRIHDRRFQRFGLHNAGGISLRFPVSGEADVAAEKRQHRQCFDYSCRARGRGCASGVANHD